jgi:hypothetical protein
METRMKKEILLVSLTVGIFFLFGSVPSADAQPIISIVNTQTEIPLPGSSFSDPIRIIVDDSTNPIFTDPESGIQTIYVTVTSGVENIVVPLTETGAETGIFKNTALFFAMQNQKEIPLGTRIKITEQLTSDDSSLINDLIGNTFYVDVFSVLNPVTFDTRSVIFGFPLGV